MLNISQDIDDIESRPSTQVKKIVDDCSNLPKMNLHMMFDTVYYGLVSTEDFAEEKAQKLLQNVKEEVKKMYKGNVQFMLK